MEEDREEGMNVPMLHCSHIRCNSMGRSEIWNLSQHFTPTGVITN